MSENKSKQQNQEVEPQDEILDGMSHVGNEEEPDSDVENIEISEIESLQKALEEEKAKVAKEKNEYLFLMAEFDNFRKRTLKEKSEIIRNAGEGVMKGLLPIVDDFERGIEAGKSTDDPDALRQGVELIYKKLVKYLEQNGVKAIESTGAVFNPDLHEAIAMVPTDDEEMKGRIIDTPSKGYTINDKVLRHAKVAVGQ